MWPKLNVVFMYFYDAVHARLEEMILNISPCSGTGVTSNAVHPGLVNTEIGRHMGVYKSWIALLFLRPLLWLFLKTPRQGAQTTIYAALSLDLESVSGRYFR